MERLSVWKPATNLKSCLGLRRDRIRRLACVSIKVTSISAMAALVFDVYFLEFWDQVYWGYKKNCAKGGVRNFVLAVVVLLLLFSSCPPIPCCISWSFWASRDCKRCSSSFTNSIAPPTIEAWSPYTTKTQKKLINNKKLYMMGKKLKSCF